MTAATNHDRDEIHVHLLLLASARYSTANCHAQPAALVTGSTSSVKPVHFAHAHARARRNILVPPCAAARHSSP